MFKRKLQMCQAHVYMQLSNAHIGSSSTGSFTGPPTKVAVNLYSQSECNCPIALVGECTGATVHIILFGGM